MKFKGLVLMITPPERAFYMIFYNINYYKGSYGRPESHISLILDYQFCACVIRISGVPQLQVIRMERLYGHK